MSGPVTPTGVEPRDGFSIARLLRRPAFLLVALAAALAAIVLLMAAAPLDRAPSYVSFLPASESPTPDARWTRAYAKIEVADDGWRPLRVRLTLRASPDASARGTQVTFLVDDRPVYHARVGAAWESHTLTIAPPRTRPPAPSVALQIQSEVSGAQAAGVGIGELRVSPVLRSAQGLTTAAIGAGLGVLLWFLLPPGAAARGLLARIAQRAARPIVGVPGLGLLLFVGGLLIADDLRWTPPFPPIDLPSFYWAARVTFVDGLSPYTVDALARGRDVLGSHIFPYLSPPPSLLLFAPLALVSFDTAALLVVRLNSALFVAGLVLIFRAVLRMPASAPITVVALVYALSFWPVYTTIAHGQVNLVVMVCLVIAWWMTRDARAHPAAAAIPLALAIGFKTYPLLWLPYLAIVRRWRVLAWTVGLVAASAIAGLVVVPWAAWSDWLTRVAPTLGYGRAPWELFEPARVYNQSLNGFMARLFGPSSFTEVPWPSPALGRALTYVLAAAAAAWHFFVCWQTRARLTSSVQDCHWSATLFLMFLLAPFSWDHHLVMVLPACLVVLRHAWEQEVSPWSRAIAGVALIALAWPLAPESPAYSEGWRTLIVSTKGYAVLALWGVTLSWLRQMADEAEQAEEAEEAEEMVRQR